MNGSTIIYTKGEKGKDGKNGKRTSNKRKGKIKIHNVNEMSEMSEMYKRKTEWREYNTKSKGNNKYNKKIYIKRKMCQKNTMVWDQAKRDSNLKPCLFQRDLEFTAKGANAISLAESGDNERPSLAEN